MPLIYVFQQFWKHLFHVPFHHSVAFLQYVNDQLGAGAEVIPANVRVNVINESIWSFLFLLRFATSRVPTDVKAVGTHHLKCCHKSTQHLPSLTPALAKLLDSCRSFVRSCFQLTLLTNDLLRIPWFAFALVGLSRTRKHLQTKRGPDAFVFGCRD